MPDRDKRARVESLLGDPDLYPDEFKAWLPRYIEQSPNIRLSTLQIPQVEVMRRVPAAGQPGGFQNGWVNYGGGWDTAGYYKDPFLRVHLTGLITGGTITVGTVIFNLPAGYRPYASSLFAVDAAAGSSAHGRIDVSSNGNVSVSNIPGNSYVGLFNISFRAYF